MIAKDFHFYLFTLKQIVDFQIVNLLVEETLNLVGSRVAIYASELGGGVIEDSEFNLENRNDINRCLTQGGVYVSDPAKERFDLVLDEIGQFYYLSLAVSYETQDEKLFVKRFLDFAHSISERMEVEFAFAYIAQPPGFDISYFENSAALNLGLRDTYWLNIFGPAFTDLIGLEKLKRAPVYAVKELIPGTVSLVVSPNPKAIDGKEELKFFIGNDYFLPKGNTKSVVPISKSGVLAVFKALASIAAPENKTFNRARLVPSFHNRNG